MLLRKRTEDDFAFFEEGAVIIFEDSIADAGVAVAQGFQRRLQHDDVALRDAQHADAAASRCAAHQHGLPASVFHAQVHLAIFLFLVESDVYGRGLAEIRADDAVDNELCVAVMHAYGDAICMRDDGENAVLAYARVVTQVTVELRFRDDDFFSGCRFGIDEQVQILG